MTVNFLALPMKNVLSDVHFLLFVSTITVILCVSMGEGMFIYVLFRKMRRAMAHTK